MDVKEERADDREVRESYRMLMESDTIVSSRRALRREICISRIVIFMLLITCMVFCGIFYTQLVHRSKNNEYTDKEKANERPAEFQTANQEVLDVQAPLLAFWMNQEAPSMKANLTWRPLHRHLNDIGLNGSSESLTIPQDGKYKLGLQLTYRERLSNNSPASQINLAHKIVWYPSGYEWMPKTILSVYETVYWNSSWLKSVFSEVIYVFNKGDIIKVESDNADLIDISGEGSTKNLLTIQFISRLRNQ